MPRHSGQIDLRKSEDILDAAAEAFSQRGLEASVEDIARRAGVSKQTVYNHFGSKENLLRALFDRRQELVMEPLGQAHSDEPLEDRLSDYVRRIVEAYLGPGYRSVMRSAIAAATTRPQIAAMVYEAGPKLGRRKLVEFLANEAAAGRIDVADADEAADFLFGMAAGSVLLRVMLDAPTERRPEKIAARARECARRFLRAYAPG
ncbi:MAG: TetR family transcriptional regulator [Alphaproteobacteria bacterium]|nr:MAG: TetR family transcriptional regulator [Caulobacteraceae bacterium]TPW07454.1 MAG: TetR family transcriptional regulator [Alphaproteobacteria bacterium]